MKARDRAGNEDPTPAQQSVTVSSLTVTITQPADRATVPTGPLLVSGTVKADGAEVGVTLNGVPAAVHGPRFAALLAITPETTSITAVATTPTGATADHRVAFTVAGPTEAALVLDPSPPSGVAPLSVAFSLPGAPAPTTIELDLEGDGVIEFRGSSLEGRTFTYPQPGLYVPRVTVTDAQGNQFTAQGLVQVYDRGALDNLLQAKWAGMKDALLAGNIPEALSQIVARARESYAGLFTALGDRLPALGADMSTIQPVYFEGDYAKYRLRRQQRVGTSLTTITHYIYFSMDADGIWRIESF